MHYLADGEQEAERGTAGLGKNSHCCHTTGARKKISILRTKLSEDAEMPARGAVLADPVAFRVAGRHRHDSSRGPGVFPTWIDTASPLAVGVLKKP